jgi:rhodanese-related sulfurtransferase
MAQNITRSVFDLVAEAEAAVACISIADGLGMAGRDDVLFVDIRDVREVAKTGRIKGARHVPRGMLEFWIDPKSPYHKEIFAEDKMFVFYCAGTWRSSLAAKSAQDMGLRNVAYMEGGIGVWAENNGPIDPPRERQADA